MLKHKFLLFISWLIRSLLYFLPESTFVSKIRGLFYSFFIRKCGNNFQVSSDVRLINLENIVIGNNVYLAPGVIVNAATEIFLGDNLLVGFNTVIVSSNHQLIDGSFRFSEPILKKIYVSNNCWIGANCTIAAGSYIHDRTLIAANTLVNNVVGPDVVYFGKSI